MGSKKEIKIEITLPDTLVYDADMVCEILGTTTDNAVKSFLEALVKERKPEFKVKIKQVDPLFPKIDTAIREDLDYDFLEGIKSEIRDEDSLHLIEAYQERINKKKKNK